MERGYGIALLLIAAPLATSAAAHGGGRYRGPPGELPPDARLLDPPPPEPLPVATVALTVTGDYLPPIGYSVRPARVAPGWSARADDDGTWQLPCGRTPMRYVVRAAGWAPVLTPPLAVAADGSAPERLHVALEQGHGISGRIRSDGGDLSRLRLAVVPERLRVPEWFALVAGRMKWEDVRVAESGAFAFVDLPAGRYAIVLSTPERTLRVARGIRAGLAGLVLSVDPAGLAPPVPAALPEPPGRAVLRVTAGSEGRIAVAAWRRSDDSRVATTCGSDVRLDLPLGEGLVLVVATVRGGVRVVTGVDPAAGRVDVPPRTTRTLTGRVVRDDGSPVIGASVRAVPLLDVPEAAFADPPFRREATSGTGGTFEVRHVAGAVRLLVAAPGLVREGGPPRVAAEIDDAGDVTLVERRSP